VTETTMTTQRADDLPERWSAQGEMEIVLPLHEPHARYIAPATVERARDGMFGNRVTRVPNHRAECRKRRCNLRCGIWCVSFLPLRAFGSVLCARLTPDTPDERRQM
jgi:hypothetical protein